MKRKRQLKSMNVKFIGEETSVKDIASIHQIREIIYNETLAGITEAVEKNKQQAALFEINDSGFILELDKQDWVASLNEANIFFENSENYEKCAFIQNLIKNHEQQQRFGKNSTSNKQHIKRKNSNPKKKKGSINTK